MSSVCLVRCPIAWDETGTHSRYTTIHERGCGGLHRLLSIGGRIDWMDGLFEEDSDGRFLDDESSAAQQSVTRPQASEELAPIFPVKIGNAIQIVNVIRQQPHTTRSVLDRSRSV